MPRQALSRAAAGMPLEDLERAVRAEKGFPVHFTDVAPAADLHRILQVHPVDHFSYWLLVQLMSCCHHCGICCICRRKSANNLTGLGERCCASWSTTSAFGLLCVCCHGSTCCIRKTVCLVVGISPLLRAQNPLGLLWSPHASCSPVLV